MTNENEFKVGESALIVPNTGFQGQMWDVVRSKDDLAPLRKKLSIHEFRLLFESIEPVFKSQQSRIDLLESAIRDLIVMSDYQVLGRDSIAVKNAKQTLRNLMENKS